MPAGRDLLLWLAFETAAGAHPDAVAVVDGTTSISYDELHRRALACAAALTRADGPQLVALAAVDPVATLAWLFGALGTGGTVAPLAASGPDRAAQLRLLRPDATVSCVDDATVDRARVDRALADRAPASAALPAGMVVCTAGTTGVPKAVVHSHATLGHAARRLQLFRLDSAGTPGRVPSDVGELRDDLLETAAAPAWGLRYATTLPLTTMAGLTVALQALLAGETVVLPKSTEPSALLDTLDATRVNNVALTPLLAQLVLRVARQRSRSLDHLLFAGIGGGPVAPALAEELEAAIGCAVAVGYGTTESGGALTMGRISDPPEVRHRTVGRALPGVDLVIDAPTRELIVHCASTAVGYVGESGALEPIERGGFATGDLARLRPDGAIELGGRADALILRGGRNIDPARIERALEDHPAVRRAAAFGVSNALVAGEQDIWTVVELEHTVGETELRAHCNRSLGASLTPRRVVAVDALPLTADGAVRRHDLYRLAAPRPTTGVNAS